MLLEEVFCGLLYTLRNFFSYIQPEFETQIFCLPSIVNSFFFFVQFFELQYFQDWLKKSGSLFRCLVGDFKIGWKYC